MPPFTFRVLASFLFLFLLFGSPFVNEGQGLSLKESGFINAEDGIFLNSEAPAQDPFEMTVIQGNTLYASAPLYFPEVQVLGSSYDEDPCRREITSYRVQKGDSLASIASRFGISVDTIVWANDLKSSSVKEGQDLIILPVPGVFHIVGPGDTVSGIAAEYKADKEEVLSCNDISGAINTGDILVVPGGKVIKPARQTSAPASGQTLSLSGFIPPASGVISQGLHWYNAVDIANACGTPVHAVAAGTVQSTGYHGIAGNYIRILHPNGVVTFYGHLSRMLVSNGQNVSQGSRIGLVGNTGYTVGATGCHIHFEVRGAANPFANYRIGHRF